ncbi:MAG TPA: hypothetical protein PLL45_11000, partial [Thermoflexales bacterium]|nr:hypothetical protein [Thermoflexales bacterium]
ASFDYAPRRLRADALRSGALLSEAEGCLRFFVCATAHTPFLAALSPDGGPELRMTRMEDRSCDILRIRTLIGTSP